MARNHLPKMGQLFHLARTCLNNMLYNKHIELETRGRTVYLSADRPHCKKVGERIHGACKRCSHAHLVPAWTVRHRRLWLERLRLCRFPRLVQTTLLADSAPYDDELWRLALSVVLGPRGNPNFIDFAELIEAGYLEQHDIDGVYLAPTPATSTTVPSLLAAAKSSTVPPNASPRINRPISTTLSRQTRTGSFPTASL